jgi:peptidyl-tRNA hydrolase
MQIEAKKVLGFLITDSEIEAIRDGRLQMSRTYMNSKGQSIRDTLTWDKTNDCLSVSHINLDLADRILS